MSSNKFRLAVLESVITAANTYPLHVRKILFEHAASKHMQIIRIAPRRGRVSIKRTTNISRLAEVLLAAGSAARRQQTSRKLERRWNAVLRVMTFSSTFVLYTWFNLLPFLPVPPSPPPTSSVSFMSWKGGFLRPFVLPWQRWCSVFLVLFFYLLVAILGSIIHSSLRNVSKLSTRLSSDFE